MINNYFDTEMLNDLYEGVYYVDKDRKITFWNKGAEEISGFKAEEIVGKHCYNNLLNHVDEGGNKLCLGGCPLHATIMDGVKRDTRVYLHHKDGYRLSIKVRTIPLVENEKIIGAIEVFVNDENSLGRYSEIEEIKQLAYMDQLTGLPNRRYLDKYIESQIIITEKMGTELGIAFIDIDFFKKVNDTYGHIVGDEVLKMVSKTMSEGLRKSDIVGRWGGEEFICVISSTSLKEMNTITEKIRMLVEASGLRNSQEEVRVTISLGATIYKAGECAEEFLSRADRLLYQSKQNGRNRVTMG